MKNKTTTIGAFPKPSCTPIGDWFPDVEDQEAKGADKGLLHRWSITDDEENSIETLTTNITESLPVLIDKKLDLFSNKVNQS